MRRDDSVFAVKLYEMEEQYGKLRSRILACERGGRERIRTVLKEACDEYRENELLLEEKARSSRSRAVAKLAEAQLDYRKKPENCWKVLHRMCTVRRIRRRRTRKRRICSTQSMRWILPHWPCSRR